MVTVISNCTGSPGRADPSAGRMRVLTMLRALDVGEVIKAEALLVSAGSVGST